MDDREETQNRLQRYKEGRTRVKKLSSLTEDKAKVRIGS